MNLKHRKNENVEAKVGDSKALKEKGSNIGFPVMMVSGVLMWICFAVITFFGPTYSFHVAGNQRPIVFVTSLFIAASLLSMVALWGSLKLKRLGHDSFWMMVLFAVAFRLVQLFAPPFQELDLYRYMWDGIVLSNGHSPYRFSPLQAAQTDLVSNPELNQIRQIAVRSESTYTILSRVHFEKYTTIYPPASQIIFAATMTIVPKHASVQAHLFAMKTMITLFDLGTMFLIAYLLSLLKCHMGWLIVYAWNPLVIKEFANSGHLDSIAVFYVMAAATLLVKFLISNQRIGKIQIPSGRKTTFYQWTTLLSSATFLGLGFGAKIYPIIFTPLFLMTVWKTSDLMKTTVFTATFAFVGALSFFPMWLEINSTKSAEGPPQKKQIEVNRAADQPLDITLSNANTNGTASPDESINEAVATTSNEGLSEFLRKWQMNELIFMIVFQNLRAMEENRTIDMPWFRVLGNPTRNSICAIGEQFVSKQESPNVMSRLITIGMFGLAYSLVLFYLIKTPYCQIDEIQFLSNCFWIVAIFFCLQPTQNPWYWTWAVPFLTFCRNRVWLAYTPLLLIYYFRFWFRELSGEYHFFGLTYSGTGLFDFCIVWLEHLPIFLMVLVVESTRLIRKRKSIS